MVRRPAVLALTLALLATACGSASFEISFGGGSGSVEEAAAFLIEGELADQLGEPLTASCPEVADPEVGVTFDCTGTTEDGLVIDFAGIVDREDHIDLNSTNLIVADRVPDWELGLADSVSATIEAPVTVDCGERFLVLGDPAEFVCELSDELGEFADLRVTITDFEAGDFSWVIE
ncbi:MAG: hypothetical protein AAGA90_18315 [Actinomycetota bacterium]